MPLIRARSIADHALAKTNGLCPFHVMCKASKIGHLSESMREFKIACTDFGVPNVLRFVLQPASAS
jgi:hypothetical protein